MKKLLPLLLLILIGCSEPEPINMDEMLIERNDVYYTKDTNQPYFGPVFSLYENGQLQTEGTIKDGKANGPWKYYHENGKRQQEGQFRNGNPFGEWKDYDVRGTYLRSRYY